MVDSHSIARKRPRVNHSPQLAVGQTLEFLTDGVRVVVDLQGLASHERETYNSAHTQCASRILRTKPEYFEVEHMGGLSDGTVAVVIKQPLVEKLPTLQTAANETISECSAATCSTDSLGTSTNVRSIPIELPCSVWGLVSLLLLLEGIPAAQWLGSGCDASLPSQTFAMAEFLECLSMRRVIMEWFQTQLKEVVFASEAAHARPPTAAQDTWPRIWHLNKVLQHLPTITAHEVLSVLAAENGGHACAVEKAVHLPMGLLTKWVAASAPHLDFRDIALTTEQWNRLALSLSRVDPAAVQSLHMSGPALSTTQEDSNKFDVMAGLFAYSKHLVHTLTDDELYGLGGGDREPPETTANCPQCDRKLTASENNDHLLPLNSYLGFTPSCRCPTCGRACEPPAGGGSWHDRLETAEKLEAPGALVDFVKSLRQELASAPSVFALCKHCSSTVGPCKPEFLSVGCWCADCHERSVLPEGPQVQIATMHEGLSTSTSHAAATICRDGPDFPHLLRSLAGTLPHMTHLSSLALRNIPRTAAILPALGELFTSLPKCLEKLVVSTIAVEGAEWGVSEKDLFFRSIGLIQNLQELQMHEWEEFVGDDAGVCMEGLHGMPELKAVRVAEVKQSAAFPPALPFKHIPVEP